MTDKRKDCPMRHENGNCTVAGGFCTAVNDPICEALHNAFDCGYRSALRQQETVTNRNEPLTLDELRKMDGEPVFAVTDRLKEWCLVHSHNSDDVIGGGIIMTRRTAEKRTYQYACYGKTWLAYRQKPEEDDHDERKENENV